MPSVNHRCDVLDDIAALCFFFIIDAQIKLEYVSYMLHSKTYAMTSSRITLHSRSVSSYVNKVYEHGAYKVQLPELYRQMQKFSSLSPTEAILYLSSELKHHDIDLEDIEIKKVQCSQPIRTLNPKDFEATQVNPKGKPTFRGYALAVAADLLSCKGKRRCLDEKEKHYKSQIIKCSPCTANYDIVVKVSYLCII